MTVSEKVIVRRYCDICKELCDKSDGDITIMVNGGDGRDVGPATIDGSLSFNAPYQCSGGDVCHYCKVKYLKKYVESLEAKDGD